MSLLLANQFSLAQTRCKHNCKNIWKHLKHLISFWTYRVVQFFVALPECKHDCKDWKLTQALRFWFILIKLFVFDVLFHSYTLQLYKTTLNQRSVVVNIGLLKGISFWFYSVQSHLPVLTGQTVKYCTLLSDILSVSSIIHSAPKCSSRQFIFHRKCVSFECAISDQHVIDISPTPNQHFPVSRPIVARLSGDNRPL